MIITTPGSTQAVMVGSSTKTPMDSDFHTSNDVEVLGSTGNKKYLEDDGGNAIIKSQELNDLDDNEGSAQQYFPNFSKRRDRILRLPWEYWYHSNLHLGFYMNVNYNDLQICHSLYRISWSLHASDAPLNADVLQIYLWRHWRYDCVSRLSTYM